jgi:hypothetical protein
VLYSSDSSHLRHAIFDSQDRLVVCTAQHHLANFCDCTVHVNGAQHRHSLCILRHELTTIAAKQHVTLTACLTALWHIHITSLIHVCLLCISHHFLSAPTFPNIYSSHFQISSTSFLQNKKFDTKPAFLQHKPQRQHGISKQRLVSAWAVSL